MPGSIVNVKAIHKSLTSKHKTVRNVSVDNMYLLNISICVKGMNRSRPFKRTLKNLA